MDVNKQINLFQDFFEKYYKAELLTALSTNKNFIIIDFVKLSMFNPELAEILLEEPEETLKAAEIAVKKFSNEEIKRFNVRLTNLPSARLKFIRDIRSQDLGKLIQVEGIVKQKSDVRPQVIAARFECPSCGNIMTVIQTSQTFKEPTSCSCGRKGKFKLLSKEMIDAQGLVLEEIPEKLEGGEQPKRINIFLKEDLVSPVSEKRTNPGSKIRVIGWVKEKYGDRLVLVGNIDCDVLLPLGTPREVAEAVSETIKKAGEGGGYILSSSNSLHKACKVENILAMVSEARRFRYVNSKPVRAA